MKQSMLDLKFDLQVYGNIGVGFGKKRMTCLTLRSVDGEEKVKRETSSTPTHTADSFSRTSWFAMQSVLIAGGLPLSSMRGRFPLLSVGNGEVVVQGEAHVRCERGQALMQGTIEG